MSSGSRWRAPVATAVALAGVYLLGIWAVAFTSQAGSVAFWWPAAGLSVGLVALAPRSWWPGLWLCILVVTFAANVTGGRPVLLATGFATGNATEAVIAGLLLKGAGGRLIGLGQLKDFVRLVSAAAAGAAAFAIVAASTMSAIDEGPFWDNLRNLFASHASATLIIVPVAMTWRSRTGIASRLEVFAQTALLTGMTLLVFAPAHGYPVAFALLPILMWAALRLDPRTVTLELLAHSIMIFVLTSLGRGPFGDTRGAGAIPIELSPPLALSYILASAVTVLPLTLAITQRSRAIDALSEREALFRRNFTESLTGMLLLAQRGDRLEIIDANDTARTMLDQPGRSVVGRYLDRILTQPMAVRGATQTMLEGDLDGWRGHVGIVHRPDSHVDVAISRISSGPEATFSAQLLDVTALHESLARTVAAEQLTNSLLDTARCIMMMTDMTGRVIRVNQATTLLTGFSEEQILGHPYWATIVVEKRVDAVREMFASGDGAEIAGSRETDVRTTTDDPLRVVWNTELVHNEDGTPRYAVLTGVDVTAERASAGLMANLFQAGISTAIIGLDAQGRIRVLNSGAESLLGYSSDDMRGRRFTDLLDEDELLERTGEADVSAWSTLTSTLDGGAESQARDWTWLSAQGRRRTVEMTICGGGSQFGPQAGFLVVGRDVTEQRHGQMMLMAALDKERMAADRLRQLDAAKNEFVSTVSHELRTPVTSIVGYTEMLADGSPVAPDPAQVPLLDTIARNGARLIRLCNDLLALAGLDTGGTVWDRGVVDLCVLARHTEESIRPLVRDRKLTVSFELSETPIPVLGDSVQLERVMLNLLSNAVKFTPDGGSVTTQVRADADEAWLVVTDTGIGIPAEEQDALFQKFFRASTAQAMAIQGTGLGLSIVAGIVAAHGGRIGVDSATGTGSSFTVRLPLRAD
ncbi:MAG: ATP-binding protein [Nocardioides sp.]